VECSHSTEVHLKLRTQVLKRGASGHNPWQKGTSEKTFSAAEMAISIYDMWEVDSGCVVPSGLFDGIRGFCASIASMDPTWKVKGPVRCLRRGLFTLSKF